jgi:UDP-galactopyranose mutase
VTRDVVPDPDWRGFTVHFKPGLDRDARIARAAAVLRVPARELEVVGERSTVLPSPRRGHAEIVRELDARLAGRRLALTGNWFGGLAIEDCALRSRSEWRRLSAGA